MGISKHVNQVIEKHRYEIINDIPVEDILFDLRAKQILSDEEVDILRDCRSNKEKANKLIIILKRRGDEDFNQFCYILQNHGAEYIQNIGLQLKKEAEEDPDVLVMPTADLRDVPPTPTSHYIVRTDFIAVISSKLKEIDEIGGRILVHGMAGSGKTIAVSQAIRHTAEVDRCFETGGVYWVKIGDISEDKLFSKLKGLCIKLGIEWKQVPQDLEEIESYLSLYLENNYETSMALFVFDDVWRESYYPYLKFAKKSIITSRFIYPDNELDHYCIPASDRFTDDEAVQLLAKYRRAEDVKNLQENPYVIRAIKSCGGLPLAIALIGGLRLNSDKQWIDAVAVIERKGNRNRLANYEFNLYGTFSLSIQQLDDEARRLFLLLGVFKKVAIPTNSIMALWRCDRITAESLLEELSSKSLLKLIESDSSDPTNRLYCVLHDLMVDYLRISPSPQESNQSYWRHLNHSLIQGYALQCKRDWHLYLDDGYYFQHLVHHAIQAADDQFLREIMSNYRWMIEKLKIVELFNLREDLQDYISYLKINRQDATKSEELLRLLHRYESYLDTDNGDFIQFLLYCAKKDSSILKEARKLACDQIKCNRSRRWMITGYPDDDTDQSLWKASKIMGKSWEDVVPSCSNPAYGNLKFSYTKNNGKSDCTIMVKDYETFKTACSLSIGEAYIHEVRISADGRLIAYATVRKKQNKKWEIYNMDIHERVPFINCAGVKTPSLECRWLQFCPVISQNPVLLTIAVNKKDIQLWNIKEYGIEETEKLNSCWNCLEGFEFTSNGESLSFWWSSNKRLQSTKSWINECQMEIWNVEKLYCEKTFLLPEFIDHVDDRYTVATASNYDYQLKRIKYSNQTQSACFVIYGKVLGLLTQEGRDSKTCSFLEGFTDFFYPIYISDKPISNVIVSDDQQLLVIPKSHENDLTLIKFVNGHAKSYINLRCSYSSHNLRFMPGSYHLFDYNKHGTQCLYQYSLDVESTIWRNIQARPLTDNVVNADKDSQEIIIDSSASFINSIPVVAQLTENRTKGIKKLKIYRNESLDLSIDYKLDQEYQNCYLYSETDSVILTRWYKCKVIGITSLTDWNNEHCHIVVTEFNSVLGSISQKGQFKYTLWEESPADIVTWKSRYRKEDNVYMFIFYIKKGENRDRWLIMMVKNSQEHKIADIGDDMYLYQSIKIIYCDEYYLITRQKIKESADCVVKWYKLEDTVNNCVLLKSHIYKEDDGIVCKIILPTQKSSSKNLNVSLSSRSLDMMKKQWGEKIANIFVAYCNEEANKECFLFERNEETTVFSHTGQLLGKSHGDIIKQFYLDAKIYRVESLFTKKYFAVFEELSGKIQFYDNVSLQLIHTIQSPYIQAWNVTGNLEQSMFICQGRTGKYSIIKQISETMNG
ncbi:Apoptotic protease-activating factor 1 [Trichoplax sp. H2]|nr:Apoptotic protease-activating factor 1 [Trichoplax sp. H2]|eukprot:RDD40482.1 Apoptotic protease-activating factor 1 [Trichoplax sp. H2]